MTLKEKSEEIYRSFMESADKIEARLREITADIERYTEEYRVANTHGDRRENAAFEDAVNNLQRCNVEYAETDKRLQLFKRVSGIETYKPIGVVVLYSTVRLTCIQDGTEYVYRIFDAGVADLDAGILSADCRIGKALLGRSVGDIIKVPHSVKGAELSYQIDEIY